MAHSFKITLLFAFIAFFLVGVSVSHAQVEPLGAVGPVGGVPDLNFGVPDYPDSISKIDFLYGGEDFTLSSTTPFTILSYSFVWARFAVEDWATVYCDNVEITGDYFALADSNFGLTSFAPLHCYEFSIVNSIDEAASAFGYAIQYVEYDTRDRHVSNADIVFGLAIIIVILFIAVCGFVFNKIVGRRKW